MSNDDIGELIILGSLSSQASACEDDPTCDCSDGCSDNCTCEDF